MNREEQMIREELMKLVSTFSDNIKVGSVKSVNATKKTCIVTLLDSDNEVECRLRASEDEASKGVWMVPKAGSSVIIGRMTQFKRHMVLMCDEIDALKIVCDAVEFNNGSNGGLVKSEVVSEQITKLVNSVNDLKTVLAAWIPVPNDGGAALKTAVTTWAGTALTPIAQAQYENNKIKH